MVHAAGGPFLQALSTGFKGSSIPVWMMRQAGRYQPAYQAMRESHGFQELCYTPELAACITQLPIREMGLDAAILFSDILFPLRALGLDVSFNHASVPSVSASGAENSLGARAAAVLHSEPRPLADVCGPIYEAAELARSRLGATPLIGFAGAPWTLISYVLAGKTAERAEAAIEYLRGNRALFESIWMKVEQVVIDHLLFQISRGCQAVQLFDSWAGMVPQEEFVRYLVPSLERIFARVKERGVPLIYYTKGLGSRLPFLSPKALSAISCDTDTNIELALDWAAASGIAVQGNLNPCLLELPWGSPELMSALDRLLSVAGKYEKYIFNLGHGVPKDAKYETVSSVVRYVQQWKRK